MIRFALEQATRRLTFQRSIEVAGKRVPIIVSPSCGLRFLFRTLENADPILTKAARALVKPGAVVWDVGANLGLFTFVAAACAGPRGRVVAFEPDPWLGKLLRRSCLRQPCDSAPVQVLPHAIAREQGMREFHIARRSRSANFLAEYADLVPFITHGTAEVRSVMAISLDDALAFLPAPDVVKIDIEGAEVEALEGAKRLLRDVRPTLLCEVFGPHSAAVSRLLRAARYTMYDAETGLPADMAPWNTIARPLPL